MTMYRTDLGPNVASILVQGVRVIRGPIPRQVRSELMAGVKAKALGRLPKDGLRPEVFFSRNHPHPIAAAERQKQEALEGVAAIASVVVSGNARMDEALSYGVRCHECGEWEAACKCPDDTPVIENHCPECNEYESECVCR